MKKKGEGKDELVNSVKKKVSFGNVIDSATYPREFLNSSPRKRERERKLSAENTKGLARLSRVIRSPGG